MREILVSGGGPAGSATAFWLAKAGFGVTVVERSTDKPYGQGIDVQNAAVEVARRMGLLEIIKENTTGEAGFALLDDDGKEIGSMGVTPAEHGSENAVIGAPSQEIEIMRGDLTTILADAAKAQGAKFKYGTTIEEIKEENNSVLVKLSGSDQPIPYHAVVGADGVASRVRNLIFSEEINRNCYRNTDTYACYFSMAIDPKDKMTMSKIQHGANGRTIWLRPINKAGTRASCYFLTTTTTADKTNYSDLLRRATDSTDTKEQISILTEIYDELRGLGPAAVRGMQESTDFYFTRITQVNLLAWHVSRCGLVGDAAYCPSPLSGGQGTPAALVGSYILAGELLLQPDNPQAAFAEYEKKFRKPVEAWSVIPLGGKAPRVIAPQTELGVRAVRAFFWAASRPIVQDLFASLPSLPGIGSKEKGKMELPNYDFTKQAG
ncbi:hypothetical protein LTR50_005931 [Elasticomyces elasticus]|nr:hypothetical protein LTR50_005931 [Elasticomyces elasticus]